MTVPLATRSMMAHESKTLLAQFGLHVVIKASSHLHGGGAPDACSAHLAGESEFG